MKTHDVLNTSGLIALIFAIDVIAIGDKNVIISVS